jgi:hypothetical protein
MTHRNALSRWLFWGSLFAYMVSLALPAYQTGTAQDHYGIEALLLGPIGFFAGHFSWVANPLLWASWAKRTGQKSGLSFLLAFLALVAAALFFFGTTTAVGSSGEFQYHASVGFYVWLGSMVLASIAALVYVPASVPVLQNVP